MHRPQASSVAGSSVQWPLLSIRLRQAPVRACASFRNRSAIPARPLSRALGVGFAGGDNKHAGHVVGAVAVLGARLGETGVLEGAATIRQIAADGRRPEVGAVAVIPSAAPLDRAAACARPRYVIGDDRPGHLRRQSAGLGRHCSRRAAARSGSGAGRTPARRGRHGRRRCPRHSTRSSTACGNAVATTGRPLAMASTSTPEVT